MSMSRDEPSDGYFMESHSAGEIFEEGAEEFRIHVDVYCKVNAQRKVVFAPNN